MRKPPPPQPPGTDAADYALVLLCAALAAWSGGESISQRPISLQFVSLIGLGTLFSYIVRRLGRGRRWLKADGALLSVAILSAAVFAAPLNDSLIEGGFPRQIGAAGFLCWALAFGSFFLWRDGTLLFQAIPAMALFGLCGCFDVYPYLTFAFFGFLLSLATLLARAHARDMIRAAKLSGFGGDLPEDSPALLEQARRGPWKAVAGPEWALLSALAVVLVSLLGAPVVRDSVQGVAGLVPTARLPLNPRRDRTPAPGAIANDAEVNVGRGPNDSLSKTPLYEVMTDGPSRYLRTARYDRWTGRGWSTGATDGRDRRRVSEQALNAISRAVRHEFSIRPLVPTTVVPVPGEIERWDGGSDPRIRRGDTVMSGRATLLKGVSRVPADAGSGRNAPREIPGFLRQTLSARSLDVRVVDFARKATDGAPDDRAKAERIRSAIAATARYNLRAAAVPADQDPAAHFLFDSREGYCDLYATTMTLCARAVGLPARYVQGFLTDAQNVDGGGAQIVLESDYHAWCEVLIDGAGWVVYDATEGTEQVPGASRGDDVVKEPFWTSESGQTLLNLGIVALALGGLGLAWWTTRGGGARPLDDRRAARALQARLMRHVERIRGRRRLPGETLRAMSTGVIDPQLIADLQEAAFGGGPRPPAELAALAARVKEATRQGRTS